MKTRSSKNERKNSENSHTVPFPPKERTPSRTRAIRRSLTSPSQNLSPESLIGLSSHQLDTSELILQASLTSSSRNLPSRAPQSMSDPPRPALGHSTARRERGYHLIQKPRPQEYKDFINAQKNTQPEFVPRPPVDPLPPISASKTGRKVQKSDIRYKRPEDARMPVGPTGSSGQITEVVVEPVSSPERPLRKMQNSNSRQ